MSHNNSGEGLLRDFGPDSSVLAITFGGLLMRVGMMPPFEFFNVLSESAPAKKLFVRDHQQSWYHRGVRGAGPDIEAVRHALEQIRDELRPERVVTLGASAGGYAALLFGRLLGVDEAHAFSPQTFISPELRRRHGDDRWERRWSALMRSGGYEPRYGDLAEVFESTPGDRTRFVVHFGRGDELGSVHAKWLASRAPEVERRRYDIDDKQVVRHLRERGELQPLLRGILLA